MCVTHRDVCYSQRYSFYCTHLTDVSDGTGQGGKGSGRMKEIEIIPSVWPDLEESHSRKDSCSGSPPSQSYTGRPGKAKKVHLTCKFW